MKRLLILLLLATPATADEAAKQTEDEFLVVVNKPNGWDRSPI